MMRCPYCRFEWLRRLQRVCPKCKAALQTTLADPPQAQQPQQPADSGFATGAMLSGALAPDSAPAPAACPPAPAPAPTYDPPSPSFDSGCSTTGGDS